LDFKNPAKNGAVEHQDPKEILEGILKREKEIEKILSDIKKIYEI